MTFVAPHLGADAYLNLPPKHGGSVGCVRYTVTFDNVAETTFAELPAGSVILDYQVLVVTAFDGTGTNTLDVGLSGDPDGLVDALDLEVAGLVRAGDGSTSPTADLHNTPLVYADTLLAQFTDSNSDAAAGSAVITVFYAMEESDA